MRRPLVYIAGPITIGDQAINIHDAVAVGQLMLEHNLAPIVPHLSCLWQAIEPNPYEVWMAYDFEIISRCDHLYRMPGESVGADREVDHAIGLAIPVWLPAHGTLAEFIKAVS